MSLLFITVIKSVTITQPTHFLKKWTPPPFCNGNAHRDRQIGSKDRSLCSKRLGKSSSCFSFESEVYDFLKRAKTGLTTFCQMTLLPPNANSL